MAEHSVLTVMLGTANLHKVEEIRAIWHGYELRAETLPGDTSWPDAPETGNTYLENALQKAKFYFELTNRPCVADDSGLEVEALGWAPGVHTKRFTPPGFSNEQKLQHMLDHLQNFPTPQQRRARYRCTAVAYGFTPEPLVAEGTLNGWIGFQPRGKGGFGYDPIFCLEDSAQTLAQAGAELKNTISHRSQAMRKLAEMLVSLRAQK